MSEEIQFEAFPKIPRLNREVVVTEKIDGTNACVYIGEDGAIKAGSRTRWITPTDDNFGFAKWVEAHADELRTLGPGTHFGEWWGAGIQRRYGLTEKRFSLFNTKRWGDEATRPACVGVVPLLASGTWEAAVPEALRLLRERGSFAAPFFPSPEGVVVYHHASGGMFKVTLEGDEAPKGARQ